MLKKWCISVACSFPRALTAAVKGRMEKIGPQNVEGRIKSFFRSTNGKCRFLHTVHKNGNWRKISYSLRLELFDRVQLAVKTYFYFSPFFFLVHKSNYFSYDEQEGSKIIWSMSFQKVSFSCFFFLEGGRKNLLIEPIIRVPIQVKQSKSTFLGQASKFAFIDEHH